MIEKGFTISNSQPHFYKLLSRVTKLGHGKAKQEPSWSWSRMKQWLRSLTTIALDSHLNMLPTLLLAWQLWVMFFEDLRAYWQHYMVLCDCCRVASDGQLISSDCPCKYTDLGHFFFLIALTFRNWKSHQSFWIFFFFFWKIRRSGNSRSTFLCGHTW